MLNECRNIIIPMNKPSLKHTRITRDLFWEIFRYLHFVDNSTLVPRGSPGHNRLGKVLPVIDHLAHCFREIYDPHCEVAVDEPMIKFQGRSSLKQYMPNKPIKRGFKVWVLGDSRNGFLSEFQVYTKGFSLYYVSVMQTTVSG